MGDVLAYIELMVVPSILRVSRCLLGPASLLVVGSVWAGAPTLTPPPGVMDLSVRVGDLRFVPSLQVSPSGFWGPVATVESSSGWYASAGLAQSPRTPSSISPVYGLSRASTVTAGFRWSPDASLSFAVTRATGLAAGGASVQRLGLSVRYDWPTYYVRIGLDPSLETLPRDRLRLSAGFSF